MVSSGETVASSSLLDKTLPGRDGSVPVFAEPWEAKAFAMIVSLADAGYFEWSDWVDCFSKQVAAATAVEVAGGKPKTYYEQWLDAAEVLLCDKGVTSREQLMAKRFAVGSVGPSHLLK